MRDESTFNHRRVKSRKVQENFSIYYSRCGFLSQILPADRLTPHWRAAFSRRDNELWPAAITDHNEPKLGISNRRLCSEKPNARGCTQRENAANYTRERIHPLRKRSSERLRVVALTPSERLRAASISGRIRLRAAARAAARQQQTAEIRSGLVGEDSSELARPNPRRVPTAS